MIDICLWVHEKFGNTKIGYNVYLHLRQNRARLNAILLFSQNYFYVALFPLKEVC